MRRIRPRLFHHAGALLALTGALVSGCASAPGPLPADFDVNDVQILPTTVPPSIDINGLPGGKLVGAGVGAGTGIGVGVLAGAAMCVATGPFFPLCVAALVPTGAAVGALTGGAVGAVRTESVEAMELKTKALTDEWAAPSYQAQMAERLRAELGGGLLDANSSRVSKWSMEVGIVELGTEGKAEFALRLVARMKLRKGTAPPVWETSKEVQSETELSSTRWLADDSKALRSILGRCIEQAARNLASDLRQAGAEAPAGPRARAKYSTSCADTPLQDERS